LDYHHKLENLQVHTKGRSDYVTEADFAVQEALMPVDPQSPSGS